MILSLPANADNSLLTDHSTQHRARRCSHTRREYRPTGKTTRTGRGTFEKLPIMLDHDYDDPDAVIQHLLRLTDPSTTASYDPQVVQTRAIALFGQLKAHNRAANGQTRSHKQATAEARTQMDQAHLALQNLLYEKRHLEREIEKCRQFAYVLPFGSRCPFYFCFPPPPVEAGVFDQLAEARVLRGSRGCYPHAPPNRGLPLQASPDPSLVYLSPNKSCQG